MLGKDLWQGSRPAPPIQDCNHPRPPAFDVADQAFAATDDTGRFAFACARVAQQDYDTAAFSAYCLVRTTSEELSETDHFL